MNYKQAYAQESFGSKSFFGLKIEVATDHEFSDSERGAFYKAAEAIRRAVGIESNLQNIEAMDAARREREQLLACFREPIFVEEVPNGYCTDYCCAHRPWFVVTTAIGRVTIGWRKRVIQIDWKGTRQGKTAETLFPNDTTTKTDYSIHAWGYEEALRYVTAITEAADART